MISYINRKRLDIEKYNFCIENSKQTRVYAYSWYLDVVADYWGVLVLDDYKAVMPIPWRRKFGIKYAYLPLWVLELGVFSIIDTINIDDFKTVIIKKFKYAESYFNTDNNTNQTNSFCSIRDVQVLNLDQNYTDILNNYRSDRKRDLKTAEKFYLTEKWNDNPEKLINLFKKNIGKKVKSIKKKDYKKLEELLKVCIAKNKGEIISIYDRADFLVASAFLLKHNKTVTILVSSTDFDNRQKGGNTFLIDKAISKFKDEFTYFNFGGSSIASIANYFTSFGAETRNYYHFKLNNLPSLLKLFKK